MNVFIALKGTHFLFLFNNYARKQKVYIRKVLLNYDIIFSLLLFVPIKKKFCMDLLKAGQHFLFLLTTV